MAGNIPLQLYRAFYRADGNAAESPQSSAHWKEFSRKFNVSFDENGNVQTIKGYGFGGNDDSRLPARIISGIGNQLLLWHLRYKGLSKEISQAKKTVRSMGLFFSQDAFRQACTKFLLKKKIEQESAPVKNILVIGDGYGTMAALLAEQYSGARIFLVDLGATLFFQAYYLGKTFPSRQHSLLTSSSKLEEGGFYYCPAEETQHLPMEEIDLAINIASMQEMTMEVVADYFRILRERKTKLFYCCNRLEKKLPDGKLTRFMEYPWAATDEHIIDEPCPWHQFFAGRANSKNMTWLGIPIPLLHRFDGVHWHRLTRLSH